jgi:oxygen-independent coproporphyrinogen-3 oxidase
LHDLRDNGPGAPVSSVYVHIPFCRDRCTYCSFPTVPDDPAQHRPFVEGVIAEARRAPPTAPLRSLYLGGGTPGLLRRADLERLLDGLAGRFGLEQDAELTLEANPTNVTEEALTDWAGLGVNRVSLGVQTFDDATLKSLARWHDAEDARRALTLLTEGWSASWSADLLVGWRGQTPEDLDRDIDGLLAHQPPHVSVYRLTVEPRTPLQQLATAGRIVALPDDQADVLDPHWSSRLQAAGYERYEVSNFAVEGRRSRHNQVYWANASYLGLGPGAASSLHPLRWRNRRDPSAWLAALESGTSVRDACERVAPGPRLLESLAIGLRTKDGLPTATLDARFTPAWRDLLLRAGRDLLDAGMLVCDEARVVVPSDHLIKVDGILRELIYRLSEASDALGAPRTGLSVMMR